MQTKFEIFNYVLNKHELQIKRTLFVDDRENTDAAAELGFQVWNLSRSRRRSGSV
jgi:putative hydrolase of the HAD superfamily